MKSCLDDVIIADTMEELAAKKPVKQSYKIRNTDRAVGARLSGELARIFGDAGLEAGTADIQFSGSAGQSFGAFNLKGVRLTLQGESNDYVGKGMGGGEIIIKPFAGQTLPPNENVIIGNTCLYGATGGSLFAAGSAGERFAVRNSGAQAIVEGLGAHGCEYMTGGFIAILGKTGRNFGAGMTNGTIFVFDPASEFESKINKESVRIERLTPEDDVAELKTMLEEHVRHTGSIKAKEILDDWGTLISSFWRIIPLAVEQKEQETASKLKAVS